MADKGILVSDAGTGESVACIDLVNNDDNSNARIAQLLANVAVTSATLAALEDGTELRSLDFGTSGLKGGMGRGDYGDSLTYNLFSSQLPSGITNNLLDCTDAESVAWTATIEQDEAAGESGQIKFMFVPLLFNSGGTKIVGILPPIILHPIIPHFSQQGNDFGSADQDYSLHLDSGGNIVFLTSMQTVPTYGSQKIGFMMTSDYTNHCIVKIFAHKLVGARPESGSTHAFYRDKEGSTSEGFALGAGE